MFCSSDSSEVDTPALLSALYATVAGLLGVNMQPVRFPGNHLLCWQTRSGWFTLSWQTVNCLCRRHFAWSLIDSLERSV